MLFSLIGSSPQNFSLPSQKVADCNLGRPSAPYNPARPMSRRLIINADDFGLTEGVNRAIAELHDAGAVTSATLMAAGPAFAHAVDLARARPRLGIGCHVVLTDGIPVSPPRSIPSLMARNGRTFRPGLGGFLAALLSHQIDPGEIERESIAQIRRLQAAGLAVTHLDAHKHTHIFPAVLTALLGAARHTGVSAVRNPFEQPWAFPLSNGTLARTSQIRLLGPLQRGFHRRPELQNGAIRTTDGTIGISATGHLDEATLGNLLQALPEGTWELVCHPGYHDLDLDQIPTRLRATRETERLALLALLSSPARDRARQTSPHPSPLHLIHYGDLAVPQPATEHRPPTTGTS